jgi:hypothetical protein
MKKTRICMAILVLLCLSTVEAQDDKRTASSNADPGEVTTQTATTSDGRKVILKSDGTWEYFRETPPDVQIPTETPPGVTLPKETSPSVAIPKSEKGTLSFDARIVSKSGDVKPIADGTFYLLDDDLNRILQTSDLKPEKRLSLLNTFSMANYGSTLGIERSAKAFARAMESVKTHIVATTTSDSNGNGQFSSLVLGTYYLMNASVIYLNTGSFADRKAILWNVKVQIHPGQNSITLSEENAVR